MLLRLIAIPLFVFSLTAHAGDGKLLTVRDAVEMNNKDAISAFGIGGAQVLTAKPLTYLGRKLDAKHRAAAELYDTLLTPYSDGVSASNLEDMRARAAAKKLVKRYGFAKMVVRGISKRYFYGGLAAFALGVERVLHTALVLNDRPADLVVCGDPKLGKEMECAERSLMGKILISRAPVRVKANEALELDRGSPEKSAASVPSR